MAAEAPGFDPRITAARPDLADAALRGRVTAARYVAGEDFRVTAGAAPVRTEPRGDASLATEALHGEIVRVFDEHEGWAWGQLRADGYVGWLPAAALGPVDPAPTHRVAALRTFVFPGPSIKLPPVETLSLGAECAVEAGDGPLVRLVSGGFVPAVHLAPREARADDFVAVAERFVGTPYLWGGKTSLGIDCSGLVQVALAATGIDGPRDSDMQAAALGVPVADVTAADLHRGDLVFWPGHVAIARGDGTLVHANAHHMAVAVEPAAAAFARIAATRAVRRLTP
jgi:cell wall-associated NlpC family hydrolase